MDSIGAEPVPYSRWSGCGNTYLFVDLRAAPDARVAALTAAAPALSRAWSPGERHDADGLVLLTAPGDLDARLTMWNADGSRGRLCGNALRCAAHWLAAERDKGAVDLMIASDAGRHAARVEPDEGGNWRATVTLDAPIFDAERIPLAPTHPTVGAPLAAGPWTVTVDLGGRPTRGLALSVGNPHLVLPVHVDPRALDVPALATPLESSSAFPERVNVSFAHPLAPTAITLRTFERGTGETAACGSGACASVVALTATGALERGVEVAVHMVGGTLGVTWSAAGPILLSGATEHLGDGAAHAPPGPT